MLIKPIVNKYFKLGHNYRNAQLLAAQEIVLNKLASSTLSENVTLKGGIVMYNLTRGNRHVTQDIDFDLIRYSIDDDSIKLFIDKMNRLSDDISISIDGDIEPLNQEEYEGARIYVILKDSENNALKIKLDLGVHTYTAIEQEKIMFLFANGDEGISIKVNPPEQIFVEKLISLARLGAVSTRYKDIYDLYYLITNDLLNIDKVCEMLNMFFAHSKKHPHDINELVDSIFNTLNNDNFAKEASKPMINWIDKSYQEVAETIKKYINRL